jgi:hypothetical protein
MSCCSTDLRKYVASGIQQHDTQWHIEAVPSIETWTVRASHFFSYTESLEKTAEFIDEFYHLFHETITPYLSFRVAQTWRKLHDAAHHIEYLLHAFCFFGDLNRVLSRDFYKTINYVQLAARICYAVGHFFATASFLSDMGYRSSLLGKYFGYASLFLATGYTLSLISLIWLHDKHHIHSTASHGHRHRHSHPLDLYTLGIYTGGLLFEILPWVKKIKWLKDYSFAIEKVRAAAGVVHAWCAINQQQRISLDITTTNNL